MPVSVIATRISSAIYLCQIAEPVILEIDGYRRRVGIEPIPDELRHRSNRLCLGLAL
jgi:hypothetical protein